MLANEDELLEASMKMRRAMVYLQRQSVLGLSPEEPYSIKDQWDAVQITGDLARYLMSDYWSA